MPLQDALYGAAVGGTISLAAVLALMQQYVQQELATPALHHAPKEERELEEQHLLQEVKLLLRDYWPHPVWEFSGYISTVWAGMWALVPATIYPGPEEVLTLRDGGTVGLHWCEPPVEAPAGPKRVVLLLPGMSNSSRTGFLQNHMQHLREAGFHAVTLNYRGIGLALTSPRIACFDSWQDFDEVLAHLERKHPGAMLFGIGYSMGAALLLKYLGEKGDSVRLKAAVGIAAPVDTPAVGKALRESWRKKCMDFCLANGGKMFMYHTLQQSKYTDKIDMHKAMLATSLAHLDEACVCRLHGYKDVDDYRSQVSARPVLSRIAVPTLIVNAADDPVVSVKTLPIEEIKANPNIYLTITKRGGHIGWGSGGLGSAAWTDNMSRDFLLACTLRRSRL